MTAVLCLGNGGLRVAWFDCFGPLRCTVDQESTCGERDAELGRNRHYRGLLPKFAADRGKGAQRRPRARRKRGRRCRRCAQHVDVEERLPTLDERADAPSLKAARRCKGADHSWSGCGWELERNSLQRSASDPTCKVSSALQGARYQRT